MPATRPSSTAICDQKPGVNRAMAKVMINVRTASSRLVVEPKFGVSTLAGAVGRGRSGPWTQRSATGNSDIPMRVMTQPVTTGGKNRTTLAKKGAIRKPKRPATITAPKIVARRALESPSEAVATAVIGPTPANVTPWTNGSRAPIFRDAERLEERAETGDEQGGRDQQCGRASVETRRAGDDDRRGDVEEFPPLDPDELEPVLAEIAALGSLLIVHAEDAEAIDRAPAASGYRYADFLASRPRGAENLAIAWLLERARWTGARTHVLHLSSSDALPMLASARRDGVAVTVETCPHYLTFTAEAVPDGATQYKCCPPIREEANRESLWQGLATDDRHRRVGPLAVDPGPQAARHGRLRRAWGGISSLQLGLTAIWSQARARGGACSASGACARGAGGSRRPAGRAALHGIRGPGSRTGSPAPPATG